MDASQVSDQTAQQIGEAWIQAVTGKDFERIAGLCHPDVNSRLMTPNRVLTLENDFDLGQAVEKWFADCRVIQVEQARVGRVGERLAIFVRLKLIEDDLPYTVEQQLYASLENGRISQLALLCSGFQPDLPPASNASPAQPDFQVHAVLQFNAAETPESTCAILTPAIKRKLAEMSSGQVLEIYVDDPSARGDIEAWCRLSGNRLLTMQAGPGQELRFYLAKK